MVRIALGRGPYNETTHFLGFQDVGALNTNHVDFVDMASRTFHMDARGDGASGYQRRRFKEATPAAQSSLPPVSHSHGNPEGR